MGRSCQHERRRTNHKWRLQQMIWFAAMMMAAQATSAGTTVAPQPAPALTAQQKQALSTYNFKGAGAALNAQVNQSVQKPSALTPIPPLQVPPIVSRNSSGQSPTPGAPTDKGSEVPPNWKPPHAELSAAAVSATAVSHEWETGVATP